VTLIKKSFEGINLIYMFYHQVAIVRIQEDLGGQQPTTHSITTPSL